MALKGSAPRLGRGLAALLGDITAQSSGSPQSGELRQLPLDLLDPNPYQPRSAIDSSTVEELAGSIRVQGILQPLLVRSNPGSQGRFQIIAGERRWRAAALAGFHEVPALFREMSDAETAASALVENLQRQDLNPIEEAEGFHRLIEDFGLTHEALGSAVSKSRAHIGNILRLLRLPAAVQDEVRGGRLSFGHARALLTHRSPEAVVAAVIEGGLSVRQTEALVARQDQQKATPQHRPKDADTEALIQRLRQRTGYRVFITRKTRDSGDFTIRFETLEQLDDIVRSFEDRRGKTGN